MTPDERAALLFGLEAAVYDEFHEITPRDGWIINKARDLAAAALREPVGEPQIPPDTFIERVVRIAQSASQGYDVPVILTAIEAVFVRRATTGGRHE